MLVHGWRFCKIFPGALRRPQIRDEAPRESRRESQRESLGIGQWRKRSKSLTGGISTDGSWWTEARIQPDRSGRILVSDLAPGIPFTVQVYEDKSPVGKSLELTLDAGEHRVIEIDLDRIRDQ